MRMDIRFSKNVAKFSSCLIVAAFFTSGCASSQKTEGRSFRPQASGLQEAKVEGPVELRLKATKNRTEKVAYLHVSNSAAFEDNQLRHQKEESLEFVSQAETADVKANASGEVERFTQVISVVSKDGVADLHDFAMPEVGERLEVTADSQGRILKSGDYPPNSIFYVSPVSLPQGKVNVGDTWTMQANWLSLEEMVPYQLDMVSILKGFWTCGKDTCAEIELSGEVGFQGPLNQTIHFKSNWKGTMYFALGAGTVVWSRVDSEERLIAENVRREVNSCLASVLISPEDTKLPGLDKPTCEGLPKTEQPVVK